MMKLARESGEGIRRILGFRFLAFEVRRGQEGACMTVPHTLHVRCRRFE